MEGYVSCVCAVCQCHINYLESGGAAAASAAALKPEMRKMKK